MKRTATFTKSLSNSSQAIVFILFFLALGPRSKSITFLLRNLLHILYMRQTENQAPRPYARQNLGSGTSKKL